uniref:Serpentine Receptor, class T n=1 Tax=Rhabditophanes sp. KR3021 TaxID=114890 RepID=A0AC35UEZ9_9BILA
MWNSFRSYFAIDTKSLISYTFWVYAILIFIVRCSGLSTLEFTAYKRVIYLFVASDIIYNAIQITNQHAYEQTNSYVFFIVHGPSLYMNETMRSLLVISEIQAYMVGMSNNLVAFVFRYCLIVRSYCLTKLQFIVLIIVNIIWNHGFYFLAFIESQKPTNTQIEASKKALSPEFFIGTEGEPLQSTLVFNPTSVISYIGLTHICMSCVIVFVGLSITFIKIQAALIENKQIMTKSTRQLQKQVTLVMSIHVITSLILFGIPMSITVFNIILNVNTNDRGYGHIFMIIMVWPIVVNPICSIILIGPCFKKFCSILHIHTDGSNPKRRISQTTLGSMFAI